MYRSTRFGLLEMKKGNEEMMKVFLVLVAPPINAVKLLMLLV
jgi:hypothetical protein